jgi:hypothetical protein
VVPLVFKTSLGAVRSPEGSTPSLLRHDPHRLLAPVSTAEVERRAVACFEPGGRRDDACTPPVKQIHLLYFATSVASLKFR